MLKCANKWATIYIAERAHTKAIINKIKLFDISYSAILRGRRKMNRSHSTQKQPNDFTSNGLEMLKSIYGISARNGLNRGIGNGNLLYANRM